MAIIIILALLFLSLRTIFRVMWYGKGIAKPDFRRADNLFLIRRNIVTNWDTPFGRRVYYTFAAVAILILLLLLFM